MSGLDADIQAAIQQEVKRQLQDAQARDKQWGTVASRTFDTWAMVTFDDSPGGMAIPCKVGDVDAYEGDRVGLLKIGDWWTIITCMTKRWASRAGVATVQTTGTTTNASFNDVPTPADVTFVKRWNTTRVRVEITAGAYPSAVSCEAEWGARFTSSGGTVNTYAIINTPFQGGGERLYSTGWDFLAGIAADTYTVRVMWRRKSGSATVQTDNFETIALDLEEVSP